MCADTNILSNNKDANANYLSDSNGANNRCANANKLSNNTFRQSITA
jgi:hypothetical protein